MDVQALPLIPLEERGHADDADCHRSTPSLNHAATSAIADGNRALRSSSNSILSGTSESDDEKVQPEPRRKKDHLTFCVIAATFSAAIGAGTTFGFGLSSLNNPQPVIIADLQPGSVCKDGLVPASNYLFELATSMFPIGSMLGSIVAGIVTDRLGRRRTLILNNLLVVPMSVLVLLADSFAILIASRVFHGAISGISMVAATAYISEISPVSHRGVLGLVNLILLPTGGIIAAFLGLPQIWGTCSMWRYVVAFPVVFSVVQVVGLIFAPSSPSYLYIYRHDAAASMIGLQKLRGAEDVEEEFNKMKAEKRNIMSMKKMSVIGLFRERSLRRQLILTLVLHVAQMLSGINGVFYYGRATFAGAGIKQAAAVALIPPVLQAIFGFVSSFFIDKTGRRVLLLHGFGVMAVSYLIMSMGFCFKEGFYPDSTSANWPGIFVLAGALGVVIGFGFGPGPLVWILTAELFPQDSRATATSVASVAHYLSDFIVGQIYLPLQRDTLPYGMITFAALNALFWLFFYILLPETSGKSSEEIQAKFKHLSENRKSNPPTELHI